MGNIIIEGKPGRCGPRQSYMKHIMLDFGKRYYEELKEEYE